MSISGYILCRVELSKRGLDKNSSDLVDRCLKINPSKRILPSFALSTTYFSSHPQPPLSPLDLPPLFPMTIAQKDIQKQSILQSNSSSNSNNQSSSSNNHHNLFEQVVLGNEELSLDRLIDEMRF